MKSWPLLESFLDNTIKAAFKINYGGIPSPDWSASLEWVHSQYKVPALAYLEDAYE